MMNTLSIFLSVRSLGSAGRDSIGKVQSERLQRLVTYARQHSPYFRDLYVDVPATITDISQLPTTEKPDLMEHFNDWVTDPELKRAELQDFLGREETIGDLVLNKYVVSTTSGTTGQPAIIVHDQLSRQVYYAVGFLRNLLTRLSLFNLFTRIKLAAVLATGGHFLGYTTVVRRAKHSSLRRKLQKVFSVFTPVSQLAKELSAFKPDILGGYPTVIYLLAKEQLQNRLRIRPYVITSAGETLHPYMRSAMEEAFGCEVLNNYGSSEVPGLTWECRYHKLHVNSDWHILEATGDQNVLVTNLSNFVQPIIRYKMSDYAVFEEEPCRCGSHHPVISVIGRDDEILPFLSDTGATIEILPLAIATVAEESEGVYQSQIVQKTRQLLELRIKALDGTDDTQVKAIAKQRIEKFLQAQGLSNVVVAISAELPQANPRSGKFRSVITLVEK